LKGVSLQDGDIPLWPHFQRDSKPMEELSGEARKPQPPLIY
jgi:hypothetical protein